MWIFVAVRPEQSKIWNPKFLAQSRPSAEIHHGVGTTIHRESSPICIPDASRSAPFACIHNDQEGVTRVTSRTPEVTVQASQSQQLNIHTLE
jgi:hypothetical protein